MSLNQYTAAHLFTGTEWLTNQSVTVEDGIISAIQPATSVIESHIIVPAFIDLQLYGAYGSLLAAEPTADSVQKIYDYSKSGGAAFCLPTVATNYPDVMYACIDAVKQYLQQGGKGVWGIHLEGPWINPDKRGAHIAECIHPPTIEEVEALLAYGKGVIKMITLAPEQCNQTIIDLINNHGIIISAGHSNATYKQAMHAFDNGISAVTHLYNAMSGLQHRSPGLVGAAFEHPRIMASIIPDGHHVDYAAINIAKKLMGERLFIITDAVTTTSSGGYQHQLDGDKYLANDTLSGSALTMIKAVQLMVQHTDTDLAEACRMASLYPSRLMGMHQYGKIEVGLPACFTLLDQAMNATAVID